MKQFSTGMVFGTVLVFGLAFVNSERPQSTDRETIWSSYLAEKMNGQAEVRLPDQSRADIVTSTTAWEAEWSDKWPESIGQSLNYMIEANKTSAGIVLLCRGEYMHDYQQCKKVVAYLRGKGVPIHVQVELVEKQ